MIEQAFAVATEFRFDVGQAILNTKSLQGAVDDLSNSSQQAMGTLNYLAGGLVTHLGLGSGGLLSVLTKAVQVSEDFHEQSLGFANNIMQNFAVLSGSIETFNDRLRTSGVIMNDISQVGLKFGIDPKELGALTQKLATPLAQRGKLGVNYAGGVDMAKNLILAAGNTGINPGAASESLYRALSEHMPLHGQLFARLANTPAFKQAHITTQAQVTGMNQDKKIDLIGKALESLAMDADALSFRLHSLHSQFVIMKEYVVQLLRPLGDAIKEPLIKMMEFANNYLKQNASKLGNIIGQLIGNLVQDPRGLLINLMQLKSFGSDFRKALHLVSLYGMFKFLRYILFELLGISFNGGLIRQAFVWIYEGVSYLVALVPWGKILTGVFSVLRAAIVEILPPFLFFLFILQVLSRARSIAKLNDIQNMITLTPRIGAAVLKLKGAMENLFWPVTALMDYLANLLAPLFETSTYVKILLPLFEWLAETLSEMGHAVVYIGAFIAGLLQVRNDIDVMAGNWLLCSDAMVTVINYAGQLADVFGMITGFFKDIIAWRDSVDQKAFSWIKDILSGTGAGGSFNKGYDDFLTAHADRLGDDGKKNTANVVNNNTINARFDMREQLEPDRIAFAVTEHLKNLAINPQQGRGFSFRGALAGAPFAGGGK